MSKTYSLVCHDDRVVLRGLKERGQMQAPVTCDEVVSRLTRFLSATSGKERVLMCDETDGEAYIAYAEFEPDQFTLNGVVPEMGAIGLLDKG